MIWNMRREWRKKRMDEEGGNGSELQPEPEQEEESEEEDEE